MQGTHSLMKFLYTTLRFAANTAVFQREHRGVYFETSVHERVVEAFTRIMRQVAFLNTTLRFAINTLGVSPQTRKVFRREHLRCLFQNVRTYAKKITQ